MQIKPLYEAQKFIQHQKHVERLRKIAGKKVQNAQSRNTIDEMHRIRHQSSDFQTKQKNELLNFQNNKILNKLLEISERKDVPIYSTIAPHYVSKKPSSMVMFNNPERKRRQQEIMETNNKLARRLLTKQSQFDRSRVMKNISEYEHVRKILHNNRRVRLVPMARLDGSGYDFSRISTTQNSRINSKSVQNITNEVSLA